MIVDLLLSVQLYIYIYMEMENIAQNILLDVFKWFFGMANSPKLEDTEYKMI